VKSMRPVEYKKGKRRQFENDDAQLCAQALCLEEMFGLTVERGAVFHAASKRRREVEFNSELRKLTEDAIHGLHALLEQSQIANRKSQIPKAVFKPACEECSLFEICLPKITGASDRLARAAKGLFSV
ncbi:MAG: Dna2/Cas4 domain-containing protein, partial [Verrucomicrobia bacterium]|nr:Dna2/Cas4 domain-containing protein [Verrucomicrobiota bacterium]